MLGAYIPGVREPPETLQLLGLTKFYGQNLGVEDISFSVSPGEIVGFLGPNGSGKTTVLRMLVGLLSITRGSAALFGTDVTLGGPLLREKVGYLPGTLSLYGHMTARGYLGFLSRMRRRDCGARITDLSRRLDLDLDRRIDDMSKGNKQKVGVIQAFMHDPDLLLLDEPTSGLDPIVQREFDDMLDEAGRRGAAVLLSSHVMGEVERLATHVAIINKGHLVVFDHVESLRDRTVRRVVLEFATDGDARRFESVPGFTVMTRSGRHVTGSIAGSQHELLQSALRQNLVTVHSPEPSLDDLFIGLVNNGDARAT